MNKILLIGSIVVVSAVIVIGLLIQWATNPDRVNAVAHAIADFDLPPDYQTDYVFDVGDYTIAAYKSGDGNSHLAFVWVPAGIIPDDKVIEGHVYGGWSRHSQHRAAVLSTETRTVRDQPAVLTISERVNGEGRLYRSAYLVFEGRDGTAVLVINQPATVWNDAAVEHLITSIR